jgi:beta-lactam-binding protein with PASTA domain
VLVKAGALEPADRVSAGELAAALDAAARRLPRPAPLPLAPSETADLTLIADDPTQLGHVPPRAPQGNGHAPTSLFDAAADPAVAVDFEGPSPAVEAAPRRKRRWPKAAALLLVLLLAGGGAYAAVRALAPTYPVPAITAGELATSATLPHGFKIHQHHLRRDGTSRGDLLGQSPRAGTKRPSGSTITVEISDGQTVAAIPSVTTLAKDDALARLKAAGFNGVVGDTPYSDTVNAGIVMDYSPKGQLEKGSTVTLTVSNGVRPIQLGDLSGLSYNNAKQILDGLALPSTQNQVYSDTVQPGYVVNTSPGPGPVPPGTAITVNVSKGPQIVTVPDVTGMSVAQATAALQGRGLQVGNIYGPSKASRVLDTQPGPGSQVAHGSSVDLFVGR